MGLRIGSTAPDCTAQSSEGTIRFHEYLGNNCGVLFSHPQELTPVCTTELGYAANRKSEFDKRNVKMLASSVDPVRGAASAAHTAAERVSHDQSLVAA
jgi:alkyl hydroperoxide reductase subunit AhpC